MDFPGSPNPNYTPFTDSFDPSSSEPFEFSDFLLLDDDIDRDSSSHCLASPEKNILPPGEGSGGATSKPADLQVKCKNGWKKSKVDDMYKVAFRTKSDLEIMDDGFKWRKYGKKSVKNSHHPRNYYKCSIEGCSVKKRVERDREDACYVITSYQGVHNHQSSRLVYYNNSLPLAFPFHLSSPHSSSL